MTTPAEALQRLRDAAASAALDAFCARHHVRVLTVFGSAGRGEESAGDLDVGVLVERDADVDLISAITDLVELAGTDDIDLAHLDRGGPLLRSARSSGPSRCTRVRPARWPRHRSPRSPRGWRSTRCVG